MHCTWRTVRRCRLEEPTGLRDHGFIVQSVCRIHLIPNSLARRSCPSILKRHRPFPLTSVMRHFISISKFHVRSNVSGSPLPLKSNIPLFLPRRTEYMHSNFRSALNSRTPSDLDIRPPLNSWDRGKVHMEQPPASQHLLVSRSEIHRSRCQYHYIRVLFRRLES